MNCPACGEPLADGATICSRCGHNSAAQTGSPLTCPRCGHRVAQSAGYCPNCGSLMNSNSQWPPPPAGYNPGPLPPPRNDGSQLGGFFSGCALTFFLGGIYGLGLAITALIYFLSRKNMPKFARGLGFGMAVGTAFLLGLAIICYPMLRGS